MQAATAEREGSPAFCCARFPAGGGDMPSTESGEGLGDGGVTGCCHHRCQTHRTHVQERLHVHVRGSSTFAMLCRQRRCCLHGHVILPCLPMFFCGFMPCGLVHMLVLVARPAACGSMSHSRPSQFNAGVRTKCCAHRAAGHRPTQPSFRNLPTVDWPKGLVVHRRLLRLYMCVTCMTEAYDRLSGLSPAAAAAPC